MDERKGSEMEQLGTYDDGTPKAAGATYDDGTPICRCDERIESCWKCRG
jgi:hypothetical protein